MILGLHLCVFQIDCGPEGFQVGTAQQQLRVFRSHVCHKANYLLSQIPFQFYCLLRTLSAAVDSPELHQAHVRKPTWLLLR